MEQFFIGCAGVILALTLLFLIRIFKTTGFFDRFIAILIISTNIVLLLLLIGFIDGRRDMYVDIAISYAALGFISSVIVAKFLDAGGAAGVEEPDDEAEELDREKLHFRENTEEEEDDDR